MMRKKISVVIPTFNRTALLKNCVEALSRQQMPADDFELIVVSDGPDMDTRDMLNSITTPLPFVQYIALDRHHGPAAARNAGWRTANAPLVAFTDDDCLPDAEWLSSLYNTWSKWNFAARMAFTGKLIVPLPDELPTDHALNTAHLQHAAFITANCACTKLALEDAGGFDERFTAAWREDSDLEFKLLENRVVILPVREAVVVHPVRQARWGVSIREQKKTMFNALLYKKFPVLFRRKIQRRPAWNYYLIIAGSGMVVAGAIMRKPWLCLTGGALYLGFTAAFLAKRLGRTSRKMRHVLEMAYTSMMIPFASVYWTLYGAVKYSVLYY